MDFLNPQKLIYEIGLRPGDRVADFGSGSGILTVFMAQAVAKSGEVSAVDVQSRALEILESRAEILDLHNIKTIHADLEKDRGSGLADESQDTVILANILFQSEKKENIIREAKRVLKARGKLVVVDWNPHPKNFFMPKDNRVFSSEEIIDLVNQDPERELKQAGDFYFGLVFRK